MKRAISIVLTCVMMIVSAFVFYHPVIRSSAAEGTIVVYPQYDERIPVCYDYGVTVHQGDRSEKLTVYNRNTTGELMLNRCLKPDFDRRFCEFAFTGEVRVDIEVYRDFTSYSILPSAKNYRNEYHDGVISVWLDKNDTNFLLRLDDDDTTILSIFADAPEEYSFDKNDPSVLYVDEKWYDPDENGIVYTIPEGIKTVYIAPGCVLYSRLLVNTKGVTICGHGMLVDPFSDVYDPSVIGESDGRMFIRVEGSNFTLRDIKMVDSQCWNIFLYGGYYHDILNVKCLTARIRTDGIAIGSGNVRIDNCFFYVSDNGIDINGDTGYHHITNCIIGTTCASLFPQHQSLNVMDFTDIYVFRANEGIINNWYNGAKIQSAVKHITFTNLDCTDVLDAPWIFNGKNMGDAEKYYTFKNCHFANIRGSSDVETWPKTMGQSIFVTNNEGDLHTSNYKMEFFNCTLDGKSIASKADFNAQLAEDNAIAFTIQNDATAGYQAIAPTSVNHVYEKKVIIGDYLLPLADQPVKADDKWLVPEAEICEALHIPENPETSGSLIGGVKYIPLSEVNLFYTPADYDSTKRAIILSPVAYSGNLLPERAWASRWNSCCNPGMTLSLYLDNGEPVLRCVDSQNRFHQGIVTPATNELKQYGAGKYTVRFDARSMDGKPYPVQVWIHKAKYDDAYRFIQKKPIETVTVSGEWAAYEAEFDLSDWDLSDDSAMIVRICSDDTPGYDVLFQNITMTKEQTECIGDVNADGAFNISDVVLLQKWLLAVPDTHLADWKAADIYDDNKLDAFDLCLMKRALLYGAESIHGFTGAR